MNQDQQFIQTHLNDDVTQLFLKVTAEKKWLVEQIHARQKVKNKLKSWYENFNLIFPKSLSVEQSSSEITAQFKANLVEGSTLLDGTGGMGIDSCYFAQKIQQVICIEQDNTTAGVAKHNFSTLNLHNIEVVNADSISFLKNINRHFDWLYFDPARRSTNQQKVYKFADCEPDIITNLQLLFQKADRVLVKASPLLDLKQALKELLKVEFVYVIAVENECKEILFVLNSKLSDLHTPQIVAHNHPDQTFEFKIDDEALETVTYSLPKKYLYEPNVAILKAGAFKSVAKYFRLDKIAPNSHLYTSDCLVNEFQGRAFEILTVSKVDEKEIKQYLNNNKANITVRNFPMKAEELKKKLKLKDGGDVYLLATTLQNGDKRIVVCKKIQPIMNNC